MNTLERVVVIGAKGQLGSDLMLAFADRAPSAVEHSMVDIQDAGAVAAMLAHFRPTLVLNAAAFHNVERCETHPGEAFAVNAVAVGGLAAQCDLVGAALLHVSTDYVFDGSASTPYREDAPTSPVNVYGVSKLAGELLVRRRAERHFIVRTSGLYGLRGSSTKGYTFIERMLAQAAAGQPLSVVNDMTFSPSYTVHVAHAVRALVDRGVFGTYHVSNAGGCTWFEFACEIFRAAKLTPRIEPVPTQRFPTYAPRPRYSVLAHAGLEGLGLPAMPPWQAGVAEYLAARPAAGSQ